MARWYLLECATAYGRMPYAVCAFAGRAVRPELNDNRLLKDHAPLLILLYQEWMPFVSEALRSCKSGRAAPARSKRAGGVWDRA